MISDGELDALYESTLQPRLQALESLRLDVRGYVIKGGLLVGVPAVLLWANDIVALAVPAGWGWLAIAVPFVGIFVGLLIAATRYLLPGFAAFANYRSRFKHEVAGEVFKIVCPAASYSPFAGIAREVFDEPGLFNTRGGYVSDDRVRGTIGRTPFEAADVSRSYTTGGKNSTTVVVFRGMFFHLDFNKRLSGTTLVDPVAGRGSSIGDRSSGLVRVALEDHAFSDRFEVWASDEVEARYILTLPMMERILALAALTDKPLYLAFKNHRAFLGVHYGRALFEPGIRETTSAAAIREMAAQFGLAEGIVEELDLNTRIWTKDVDASLLHAPDDASPFSALDEAVRDGTMTPEKMWAAGVQSVLDAGKDDPAVAQPASTSIAIDRAGQDTTIRYGGTIGLLIAVALWMAAAAVALAAARLLPEYFRQPSLTPLVSWIPPIPYASSLVTSEPAVWFAVSTVASGVFLLMWAFQVRRVEIRPDAVLIWRGLRPLPRVYARPPYGAISRMNSVVYLGKVGTLSFFNATASPTLSEQEAGWVATEMRRALRDTAR